MGKNSSTYEILMERFPLLGLQAATWEPLALKEKSIPVLDLEKVEILYVYGMESALIYFQARDWLKKNRERRLVLLEKKGGAIASFLKRAEAEEILSCPQVHLSLLTTGELDRLAEQFPVRRIEVVGGSRSLRLQLLRKTTLAHALYLDRLHGYQPFQNFLQNLHQLPRSFYANGLKGAFRDVPAIVCGAGPSLQDSIEEIRSLENKALIIAGGSTLAALSSKGISPHFGMALDPNLEEYRRLRNSFAFEVPLLYSTRVFPAVFQTCNGPFGYMRSGIGGVNELWIEEELGLLDPLIGDVLSPESISVTAICLAWAQFLGCNPILLNGVDLAYTGKKRYASGVDEEDEELSFVAIDQEKSAPDRILKRKDRNGNPIYTAVRWLMESASISYFAKKHKKVRFINTTEGGIGFKGIDYMPLREAADKYIQKELDIRSMVQKKIEESPMPANTKSCIEEKLKELRISLDAVISHLQILCGQKKGSTPLAEMDLKEELAFSILFYDAQIILNQKFRENEKPWQQFLELAQKYKEVFIQTVL